MYCYQNGNIELSINQQKGYIESLKYKGKEYIGANVPMFVIALRDEQGVDTLCQSFV